MQPSFWDSYSFFAPLSVRDAGAPAGLLLFISIVVVLELVLKGFALYRSARLGQTGWFIALLLINTAGIFPLIYLLATKSEKK